MRTITFIALVTFLFQSCEMEKKAQAPSARVSAGAGYSRVFGGDSWKGNVGEAVDISFNLPFSPTSSVGAGLGASFQGSKYEETYVDGRVNLAYINLPVLYTYEARSGLYIEAGLQPGLLVKANDRYNGANHDYKDAVKSFDLGIPVGGGFRFSNGLGVGLRIIPGITNFDDTGGESSRNFLGLLLVSYRFWKGKQHKN